MRRLSRLLLPLVVVLVAAPAGLRADDVPEEVRRYYEQAQDLLAEGDARKAYSAISRGKAKNPDSVDFWELYVRIWRALDKSEDVLWERVIGKQEELHPESPNFELLRARLAEDEDERIVHLEAAAARAPDALEPRLLLARAYVARGDDGLAEELLDAILERDPSNEVALVTKGDLMILSGFSRSALDYARESLESQDLPGLHDLAARALLLVAENDASVLEEALTEAKKAVAGRADPAYVLTQAEIHDRLGQEAEALALLEEHHGRTRAPALGARLGRLRFRAGAYDDAVEGLALLARKDAAYAKALAVAHARRGRAKEARAALAHVLRLDPEARPMAAAVELLLGDASAARGRLEGVDEEEAAFLLAASYAWEGEVAEATRHAGEKAREGDRAGEEWLLLVVEARLFERLAGAAESGRTQLLRARHAAAGAGVASATVPDFEPSVAANTRGFMGRHVTYRRSLCGSWFEPAQLIPIAPTMIDEVQAIGPGVVGACECERDGQRLFPFNAQKMEGGNITITVPGNEGWEEAEGAFAEGAAALVDGEWASADAAFGRALEREPAWARALLLQAVAKALAGSDLPGAAGQAREAAAALPEDWEGGRVALLVRLLAGQDVAGEARAMSERRESHATRLLEEL